jgi:phospholipid/cholesterol/gamma-HCH transport system permease protein
MFISFLVLTSDTIVFSFKGVRTRKVPLRTFLEQAVLIGYQSLGIVALIAFLVGLTTALQAAAQLKQFGADIYIANMVGLAMIVELGPLMTAILMAGRVGSSIAAEISTMVISEEMDALKTMGVNPLRYVLTPKMLAITLTQPLLTTVADLVGILGGLIVAMLYLDLSFSVFWNQLVGSVGLLDVSQGVLKSFVFAWIIGLVSAFIGFRARGGAAGVGVATTNAVVASIFLVITADAIFSIIFYFGD